MGLDIYLRKCADLAAATAAEKAFEEASDGLWADSVPGDERDAKLAALAKQFNTNTWGSSNTIESADCPDSALDPEHTFKVGYLRSSYNESGINAVMRRAGLAGLDEIFAAPEDGGDFCPDWDASLVRVNDAIEKYSAFINGPGGDLDVMEVRPMFEFGVTDAKAALECYLEGIKGSAFDAWRSREGHFMPKGNTIRAVITKNYQRPAPGDLIGALIGGPAFYLVIDKEKAEKEDWHLTALRIVKETIEYVIAQPDRGHFYLYWSG